MSSSQDDPEDTKEMDTKFPVRIVGAGTSARNRELLVHFWIVSTVDHSEVLYTDTLYEGEWWECLSSAAEVRAFFEETPTYPSELAALKIIVGAVDKPLGVQVGLGKRRLRFHMQPEFVPYG
jgi:hypothetical protein